jgi:hypothetical protein
MQPLVRTRRQSEHRGEVQLPLTCPEFGGLSFTLVSQRKSCGKFDIMHRR